MINLQMKVNNKTLLKLGEKLIDYNKNFRFYITTKLANPHYQPELCIKVSLKFQLTLLNFMVTADGLEDQMVNIAIKIEEPQKDELRQRNILDYFETKQKQQHTEKMILKMLSEATGNVIDNEPLINTLESSKVESLEIEEKLKMQQQ